MSSHSQHINELANLCVKCGLCSTHCPTFKLTASENESPRGRIAMIQALANQQLPADDHMLAHIDHCLGCRNCERVCPSGVRYGSLLDEGKALINQSRPLDINTRLFNRLVVSDRALTLLFKAIRLVQRLPLQSLWQALPFARLLKQLPRLHSPAEKLKEVYPARRKPVGHVALFVGCMENAMDRRTAHSAIKVLNLLGYVVSIPRQQGCCGAMAQHSGELEQARHLAEHNANVFARAEKVIFLATGCGAQLKDYQQLCKSNSVLPQSMEVCDFINQQAWPANLQPQPLNAKVAIHEPCTQRNVLKQTGSATKLLAHIPGVELIEMQSNDTCCGAAGSYFMRFPETANTLRQPKLDEITHENANLVASTNIGCCLHLQAGLQQNADSQGETTQVMHPVEILARQLV